MNEIKVWSINLHRLHINSHVSSVTGKEKVRYGSMETAQKAAISMKEKCGKSFDAYECLFCNGFHIGKSSN